MTETKTKTETDAETEVCDICFGHATVHLCGHCNSVSEDEAAEEDREMIRAVVGLLDDVERGVLEPGELRDAVVDLADWDDSGRP